MAGVFDDPTGVTGTFYWDGDWTTAGAGIGRSLIVDNGIRVVLSGPATVYIG